MIGDWPDQLLRHHTRSTHGRTLYTRLEVPPFPIVPGIKHPAHSSIPRSNYSQGISISVSCRPPDQRAPIPAPRLSAAMTKVSAVDGPFRLITTPRHKTGKTDQYTTSATSMASIHNCLIRCFNGIYHWAVLVQPREYRYFVPYAYAAWEGLDAHHRGEETHCFPKIEKDTGKEGLMRANVAQHEAFHDDLGAMGKYLRSLLEEDLSKFSGQRLQQIMDGFCEPLVQHLTDEIETLLSLEEYGDTLNLQGIMDEEAQHTMKGLSKTTIIPAILLNHDVGFEGGIHSSFPPIPAVPRFLLMHVFTLWNRRWWKYASCNTSGKLKV